MFSNIGLNLRVTGHCNQGGRKYMEDAFVVGYQQSENFKELVYAYFGIFDGHGGREAALYAKENLMNNIVCQKEFWSDDDSRVLKAIREGFLATHHAMWKEVEKWPKTVSGLPSTSGTTSSIAFIRNQKLYIGHVGDSKIVLGYQMSDSNAWIAKAVTNDHKPESIEEKKRIDGAGGLVLVKAGVERVVWNRPHPDHKGPILRSTPVDQIPFLAVSRSLGDLWSFNYITNEFVVSPEPDVEVIDLDPRIHRCVVFGSDGLWNMITAQTAVRMVQKTDEENEKTILEGSHLASESDKQMSNPSKLLVDTALKNWFTFGMRADNISVVTVMLDPAGPCRREVLLKRRVMKRLRPRDEINEDEAGKSSVVVREDRKRSLECVECPKEKEPPCKERKLSTENSEAIPKNLPKPVILSPIKIDKSNKWKCVSNDAKVKKKGHDPPDGEPPTPKPKERAGEENAPTEKNDAPYQSNSNAKENGRVHLCEVDNFFTLTDRTSDCGETRNVPEKDTLVTPKAKSTLTCRGNALRKKSFNTLRLQTTCRTRAQSGLQKLKV